MNWRDIPIDTVNCHLAITVCKEMAELADELREFLKDQEDADHNGVSYVPNDAMRLLMRLNELFPEDGQ